MDVNLETAVNPQIATVPPIAIPPGPGVQPPNQDFFFRSGEGGPASTEQGESAKQLPWEGGRLGGIPTRGFSSILGTKRLIFFIPNLSPEKWVPGHIPTPGYVVC